MVNNVWLSFPDFADSKQNILVWHNSRSDEMVNCWVLLIPERQYFWTTESKKIGKAVSHQEWKKSFISMCVFSDFPEEKNLLIH